MQELIHVSYIKKVLNRFSMINSKPVSTPLATHFKLSKQQKPTEDADIAYDENSLFKCCG